MLRCDLAVVHRDGEALVLDANPGIPARPLAQFGGSPLEDGYERGGRFVLVMCAVRPRQLEPVAACVPDARYAYPAADVREVASAEDGHGAHRRDEFQRLGGAVDEGGRSGIGNDGGQRSVVVEEQHRLSCAGDADQLTVGRQRIREFRDPLVTSADGDVGQVGEHDVGTVVRQVVGTSGPVDTDHERESAVTARRHACGGVLDDDTPLRSRTELTGGFQKHCGIGLFGCPTFAGDSVDADAEQVVDPGGLQCLPALRARRIGRGSDADALQLPGQVDRRPEERHVAGERTVEVEEHRVVVTRVDGDRQLHDTEEGTSWCSNSRTWRVVFTTVSGFRLIDSMPTRTRNSAMSG